MITAENLWFGGEAGRSKAYQTEETAVTKEEKQDRQEIDSFSWYLLVFERQLRSLDSTL